MKSKLSILLVLTIISLSSLSQIKISTNYREDGVWNEEKQEWIIISTDEEEITSFEFNEEFTMFKHTTFSGTNSYLIKSIMNIGDYNYLIEFDGELGTNFSLGIDFINNFTMIFYTKDGTSCMISRTINQKWVEKE